MPKADLVQTINQNLALRNGEFGAGGSVVQVTSLAMSSPFSGDFQIIDAGRLIVGNSSTSGGRVVASPSGFFGYDGNGVSTLALYVQDAYPAACTPATRTAHTCAGTMPAALSRCAMRRT